MQLQLEISRPTLELSVGTTPLEQAPPQTLHLNLGGAASITQVAGLPAALLYNREREHHLGVQDMDTITGLDLALDARVPYTTLSASAGAQLVGWKYPTAASVARTLEAKLADTLHILDFGADPTGALPADAAFAAAIAESMAHGNKTIRLGSGTTYRLNGTVTIPQGIMFVADGSQGSTQGYGCTILHYSTADCFVWDGTGASAAGTGGGMANVLILKQDTYLGGAAIKVYATDNDHRPGEMLFTNILIYGRGSTVHAEGKGGLWDRCAVFDGHNCDDYGARGVRSIVLYKFRCAEARVANETVLLHQVSHFYATGLAVDTGDATATQGTTIKGNNDGIYLAEAALASNLVIAEYDGPVGGPDAAPPAAQPISSTANFHFQGKIGGSFTNNDKWVTGTLLASFSRAGFVLVNKAIGLSCLTNINPYIMLSKRATVTDVAGNGTPSYPIPWDTEEVDRGNLVAPPVTTISIKCAGAYRYYLSILLRGLLSTHTRLDVNIVRTGSVTQTWVKTINPAALMVPGGDLTVEMLVPVIRCEYDDQVSARITVTNGTKVVDIYGAAGDLHSFMTLEYIP